jgi:hypothetical protein
MDNDTYNRCREMLEVIGEVLDRWIERTSENDIIKCEVNDDSRG